MNNLIKYWQQFKTEEIAADLMVVILSFLLSAYLTILLCRWAARRQSDIRWYFSFLGASAAIGLVCLLIGLGFFFTAGYLPYGVVVWIYICQRLPIIVLPPAVIVIIYYQKKSHRDAPRKSG